ncbi:MAG: rRNA adenine dimethyltransferase family protein [Arcanobacterium sp.]|nr:rRNA adenine dimethyltransferase family protein [Arcanobacterium sp.]
MSEGSSPDSGVHAGGAARSHEQVPHPAPTGSDGAPALLAPSEIRSIVSALGINPTKKLGQNFVHDAATVRRIVRDSGVGDGDCVVEVGPGLGSLTLGLLEAGAYVSAIEIDPVLAGALPATIAHRAGGSADHFAVVLRDALKVGGVEDLAIPPAWQGRQGGSSESQGEPRKDDESPYFQPTHLVANLPYNVAVPVLLTLLDVLPSLQFVTVMVQAEVADRLAAAPGSRTYGVPSVKAAWYGTARRGAKIARSVFWPVPNVDSALVHMSLYGPGREYGSAGGLSPLRNSSALVGSDERCGTHVTATGDDEARNGIHQAHVMRQPCVAKSRVFEVIDAAFAQRRKTLRAALSSWAGSASRAEAILKAARIDPGERGENLTIDDFIAIACAHVD